MSTAFLSFLLAGLFSTWLYFKLSKHSIDRVRQNLIAASLVGFFVFLVILMITQRFLTD